MSRLLLPTMCVVLFSVLPGYSGDKKEAKVPFEVYAKGYFVKNNAAPGNPAYLVLPDKKSFDETFGIARVMGAKPKFVDEKLFEANMIVTVIKSGNAITTYEVEQVRHDKGKLFVQYKAMQGNASTAQFRSPLIVSVPRKNVEQIVFIENGKEASKVEVKK